MDETLCQKVSQIIARWQRNIETRECRFYREVYSVVTDLSALASPSFPYPLLFLFPIPFPSSCLISPLLLSSRVTPCSVLKGYNGLQAQEIKLIKREVGH